MFYSNLNAENFEFYEKKIRPVFIEHCYRCHSNETGKSRGGLVVDSIESMKLGDESESAIVPENHRESTLWRTMNWIDSIKMAQSVFVGSNINALGLILFSFKTRSN